MSPRDPIEGTGHPEDTPPSARDRREVDLLTRLEAGEPLPDDVAEDDELAARLAGYDRLRGALGQAGDDLAPPEGWRQGVLDRIDQRRARRGAARRRRWLGTAAALAAGLILVLWPADEVPVGPGPGPTGPVLVAEILASAETTRRGLEAQPGDRLRLRASTDGRPHAELRIYRGDDELVLRCGDGPGCSRSGDELVALVPLDRPGVYQTVLLWGDAPMPAPESALGGSLDLDTAAAVDIGADYELGPEIEVR
ncbi:MAG: hypothetical protein AAGD06_02190 [Acidobacteriota bacterium]